MLWVFLDPRVSEAKWLHLIAKSKVDMVTLMDDIVKSVIRMF